MKRSSKRQKSTIQTTKPKAKKSLKKSGNYFLYGLLAGIITFFTNYLYFSTDGDSIFILSKGVLILTSVVLSAVIFYSIFKVEEKQTANISKYTFLLLLLFSISISLIPIKEYSNEFVILYQKLIAFQNILILPSIVLGIISLWIHKAKLQELINNLYAEKETQKEKLSIKERILNPLKQLFSKKELLSTSLLFVIIGISIITLFYRLDYFDLYSDEGTTSQGAVGYYHSGEFKFWNFAQDELLDIEYRRAIPHQFLVAQSYKIFGISTWSTRFPSVIFGIILIILGYFVARYYIKDPFAALLIVFSFSLYFEFLLLQRWGRMYAVLFPSFLFLFYLSYRFLTEPLPEKFNKFKEDSFFNKYLNFNYLISPLILIVLILNITLHVNSAIIFAILFLFIIVSVLLFKEKKYIFLIILGTMIIIFQVFHPFLFRYKTFTFFEVDHSDIYLQFFFGYPFSWKTSMVILAIGISALLFAKNKFFTKRYLSLYLAAFFGWIFFALIINFSVSFRYMSFLSPLAIFLIIGLFVIIIKTLFNRYVHILLAVLLIASVLVQFNSRYDDLYVKNFASPAKPSVAWKKIIENYKEGEIIYRHWGTMLYFDDIDSTAKFKSIGSGKKYKLPLNILLDSLKNYKSGWLTWNTHNSHVILKNVQDYCNLYFDKVAGYGIDNLGVEIFHYSDSLLVDSTKFAFDRLLPIANLNLENDFSIVFLININEATVGVPFYFTKKNNNYISIGFNPVNDNSFLIDYKTDPPIKLKSSILTSNKWYHITLYKNAKQIGLYVDGQLIKNESLNSTLADIVKFKVNTTFNGQINDIRIYDFVLNQKQIQTVIQNTNNKNSEVLISENEEFRTLFHWQKQ